MSVALPQLDEYEKKEKCGLFAIWGTPHASQITYQALFAQQHRGQESAGIAVTNGVGLEGHTGMGLVSQVFNPRMLREDLKGHAAIGHIRYSTTGSSRLCNAQPLMRQFLLGPVAVAHNGNLITPPCFASNTRSMAIFFRARPIRKLSSIFWPSPRMPRNTIRCRMF